MKTLIPVALIATLALAGCSREESGTAPAPTATSNAPTAAAQTEAVYGDEAPVAIEAKSAADAHAASEDHAHNPDGSHAGEAKADDHGHEHEEGAAAHEH